MRNIKRILITLGLSALLLVGTQAQTNQGAVENTVDTITYAEPSFWVGVAGGANLNYYRGTTQILDANVTVPSAFNHGSGLGLYVAPLLEFHKPNTMFGFMLQVGLDARNGAWEQKATPCNCPEDLNTDLSYLTIEPSIRIAPFKGDLYLYAGPRIALDMSHSFTYQQGINPDIPNQVAPPEVNGEFSDMATRIISMQVGVGYDIHLTARDKRTQYVMSSFVAFHPYFGQFPRTIETWNVNTLRVGVSLKFGRGRKVVHSAPVVAEIPVVVAPVVVVVPPVVVAPVVVTPVVIEFTTRILFDFDKSNLKLEEQGKLDKLILILNEYPTINIKIQGYASFEGTKEYNQPLSERRARSVFQYLLTKGIAHQRMTTIGYGETSPKYSNETVVGRANNRSVEFVIINLSK